MYAHGYTVIYTTYANYSCLKFLANTLGPLRIFPLNHTIQSTVVLLALGSFVSETLKARSALYTDTMGVEEEIKLLFIL